MAGANYSPEHVRALIESYPVILAKVDTDRAGLGYLVQLADLDRVLGYLSRQQWEVVLLHGIIGLTQRETAGELNVSQPTVQRRYQDALVEITYQINGGIE